MIPDDRPPLDAAESEQLDFESAGHEIHDRIRRLHPICRSITGNGVRETLRLITGEIPLDVREIASGTPVFDWLVPKEWNIRDAYIKNVDGERVVDFNASNLHVVSYSVPVRSRMSLAELQPHLYSIPERPDWIPYKTSYYRETWGFCLSERQRSSLVDDLYDVCIDSTLETGHLTYGECCLRGTRTLKFWSPLTSAILRCATTTCRVFRSQSRWPGCSNPEHDATPIDSCSYRGRLDRSRGSRSTKSARWRSNMGWCWPASATVAR